jgi:hypothetical protein
MFLFIFDRLIHRLVFILFYRTSSTDVFIRSLDLPPVPSSFFIRSPDLPCVSVIVALIRSLDLPCVSVIVALARSLDLPQTLSSSLLGR